MKGERRRKMGERVKGGDLYGTPPETKVWMHLCFIWEIMRILTG